MPIPAPSDGGRSGVATSETFEESTLDRRASALAEGIVERVLGQMAAKYLDAITTRLVKDDAGQLLRVDTATGSPALNAEGVLFDMRTVFGGVPASHVKPISVGAATMEMNINGLGWMPCTATPLAEFKDVLVWSLRIRVTVAGTAQALIWVAAHQGRTQP